MKLHFGHLVGLAALAIGGCAAFFSVFGISQLFAGAFLAVVIMASALEFGKLVLASHLQRYWKKLGKIRRTYLSTLVIILMIITSAGIYGLLSSAYQKTYTDYTIMENQVSFLQQKEGFFQLDIDRYDKDIAQINDNIGTLSGAKVSSIQVRDTTSTTGIRNTISTAELRAAQSRIKIEETNKRGLEVKRIIAIDSLNTYKLKILTLQNNTEISGELGPLIYLKELTGFSMDKVVNFFIILLVFVFDPLAIMLVLEANRIFEEKRIEREEEEKEENKGIPTSLRLKGHVDENEKVHLDKVISMDVINAINEEPKIITPSQTETYVEDDETIELKKTLRETISKAEFNSPGVFVVEPPEVFDVVQPKVEEKKNIADLYNGATSAPLNEEPKVGPTNTGSTQPAPKAEPNININPRKNARNFATRIPRKRGY